MTSNTLVYSYTIAIEDQSQVYSHVPTLVYQIVFTEIYIQHFFTVQCVLINFGMPVHIHGVIYVCILRLFCD